MIPALYALVFAVAFTVARVQARADIQDMPHGPNLEALDRRTANIAALRELKDLQARLGRRLSRAEARALFRNGRVA